MLARSEPDSKDARGLSLFLVEADETVHIRRLEHKLGIHSSPTCEIQFGNTPALLIGKRRLGLIRYAMSMMNGARLGVSAQALGIAEAAYQMPVATLRSASSSARSSIHSGGVSHVALDARRDRSNAGADLRDRVLGGPEQGPDARSRREGTRILPTASGRSGPIGWHPC